MSCKYSYPTYITPLLTTHGPPSWWCMVSGASPVALLVVSDCCPRAGRPGLGRSCCSGGRVNRGCCGRGRHDLQGRWCSIAAWDQTGFIALAFHRTRRARRLKASVNSGLLWS